MHNVAQIPVMPADEQYGNRHLPGNAPEPPPGQSGSMQYTAYAMKAGPRYKQPERPFFRCRQRHGQQSLSVDDNPLFHRGNMRGFPGRKICHFALVSSPPIAPARAACFFSHRRSRMARQRWAFFASSSETCPAGLPSRS